ncbi:30S ribosomal protein S17 [Candidatus Woesearchaeota archaeon]|nr:30S ribosomal protein S17 [Candidatus Woesearchaeota archaeon]
MAEEKQCKDKKCPIHGNVKPRGKIFIGRVKSAKMQNTVIVEWERKFYLKKYERYETRRSRVAAHNPECLNAREGDIVKIQETRPLSKTKHFTIIEIVKRAGEQ